MAATKPWSSPVNVLPHLRLTRRCYPLSHSHTLFLPRALSLPHLRLPRRCYPHSHSHTLSRVRALSTTPALDAPVVALAAHEHVAERGGRHDSLSEALALLLEEFMRLLRAAAPRQCLATTARQKSSSDEHARTHARTNNWWIWVSFRLWQQSQASTRLQTRGHVQVYAGTHLPRVSTTCR